MSAIIQHIKGTAADWASHDIVLSDGEIALLKRASGAPKIKIGNGTGKFSELPFVGGDVKSASTSTVTLSNQDDVRCGTVSALDINLPASPDEDFCACLSFTSGATSPLVTFSAEVTFSGDSVTEGDFVPVSGKHYTVLLWYDGAWQGAVRGV